MKTRTPRPRWYVGIKEGPWETFKSATPPTEASHGHRYLASWGPFTTKRGADFGARFGKGNPHTPNVYLCERIAKRHAHNPYKGAAL